MRRVGQFVAHVRARVDPGEADLVRRMLPAAAVAVFDAMPVADRRHGLDVVARLVDADQHDPDVLVAALMHDAAKGHRMRLWHRIAGVMIEALSPRMLARLASSDPGSWRHPFHLYLHHEALSADLAVRAGCTPRAAAFIRGTVSAVDTELLRALRAADDAS